MKEFLDLYPDDDNRTPFRLNHTHHGHRFLTFEGTAYVFCTACALGQPADPMPHVVTDYERDPRD